MNVPVLLSLGSSICFLTAVFLLIRNRRKINLTAGEFIPLLVSLILYSFVEISNFLENSSITAYFDEAEDVAEIVFSLVFIFFANNWRQQRSLSDLKKHESWLRVTLESLADGVMTTDRYGKVQQLNKAMELLTGWSRNEAVGMDAGKILEFVDPKTSQPVAFDPVREALNSVTDNSHMARSLHLRSSDGRITSISEKTTSIRSPDNELLGSVGVYRDMTEYDSMVEQLNHIHKMEAIGQLAGGVAHDFNNMLAGIMGGADLLTAKMTPGELEKHGNLLKMILKAAKGASDLIANLLAFSRKSKIVSRPLIIQDVLDSTFAMAERTIDKKIRLEKRFPADRLTVIGDPSQLQNCFLNLILNARDAISGRGSITVTADMTQCDQSWCDLSGFQVVPGTYVFVEVQDDGCGIPEEIQKKIFEPFFTTKTVNKGTGLGLAAVYGIVCSHGGAITLESQSGQGSSFRIYLPATHLKVETAVRQALGHEEQGRGTVLIIDDEPVVRQAARMILEQSGFGTLVAASGNEGLEMYRQHGRDVGAVLLDMVMPGMDGNEVLTELRRIDPGVKVILSSGLPLNTFVVSDSADFLKKPYRRDDLVKAVRHATAARVS